MTLSEPIKRFSGEGRTHRRCSHTDYTIHRDRKQVSPSASPSGLCFEKLPPEVRSMIYGHLFVRDDALRPLCREDRCMESRGTAHAPNVGQGIGLLRVNRQIHAEATEALYGKNGFLLYALDFGDGVLSFLKAIGAKNRRTIRNLQLDWQHGINKINQTSHAADLLTMVSDMDNPLRKDLAKMLHDVGRTTIDKIVNALDLMVGSSQLQHLTVLCPGNESPGHPDNHCGEYRRCSGCHHAVPGVLSKIKGLRSLTVGDTDWWDELKVLAIDMGAQVLNVTQMDCHELPSKTASRLEKEGWKVGITWRDPDGDEFRRVATHTLVGEASRPQSDSRQWCPCFRRIYVCDSHAGDFAESEGSECEDEEDWLTDDDEYYGGCEDKANFGAGFPAPALGSRGRVEHWIATQLTDVSTA
ncbi:MAG: hypothetical protein M1833_007067 [Piccolia ochrophora]|nr:MAG: hypothetical protein M1833_007067 [Piccolia ochrophora]